MISAKMMIVVTLVDKWNKKIGVYFESTKVIYHGVYLKWKWKVANIVILARKQVLCKKVSGNNFDKLDDKRQYDGCCEVNG